MKKNDLLTGLCEQIGCNGEGIFHIDGTTFFVPYCLPGEKVTFKILKVKGNIGYGKIERILSSSPDRITPVCPVYQKCGGCQFLHTDYLKQLSFKSSIVKTAFKKIADINLDIESTYYGKKIYGYRNKLQLPVREQKGQVKIGFFRENSHDVVQIDNCPIQFENSAFIIKVFKEFIDGNFITAYNEDTNLGLIRHVVVREVNNSYLLTVVINGDKLPHENRLIALLSQKFADFSLYININKSRSNVIFGEKFILLYGSGYLDLNEFGISYTLGPQSFLQVNTEVKNLMYEKVLSLFDDDTLTAIDAFSGAGVLTAMLAKRCKHAYGVEIVPEAVKSAQMLAKNNGLEDKMTSICGSCEDVLPDLIKKVTANNQKTLLVLDPPRKGVDLKSLSAILKSQPDKIIYIACSPQSLARDIGVLCGTLVINDGKILKADLQNPDNLSTWQNEDHSNSDFKNSHLPTAAQYNDSQIACQYKMGKYKIDKAFLFDLFPHTKHIETVISLTRTC